MFRPMYSKQVFIVWTSFEFISVFLIGCLVETRNYSILSLAFVASSFRVTEENLVFETVQSGPSLHLNFFTALKGTHFYILFYRDIYFEVSEALSQFTYTYIIAKTPFTSREIPQLCM